jgi:hypothetical protein
MTPRTNSEEMAVQLDEIIGACHDQHAPPSADEPGATCRPASDKSPASRDKSPRPFDARSDAPAPKNAASKRDDERQNARVVSEKTCFEKSPGGTNDPLAASGKSADNATTSTAPAPGDHHDAPAHPHSNPTAHMAKLLADRIRARANAKD